jgi:arginyl-tRNA synthetase
VYLKLLQQLKTALSAHIRDNYGVEISVNLEKPPKIEMGEAASPVCFELAKRLKRAPRQIAQEIATNLPTLAGVSRIEVAGAGYLNAFLDRGAFWSRATAEEQAGKTRPRGAEERGEPQKVIVEHTSINPNKAAHIGHLRNAVLGDTIARILRNAGERVQVQNYIDNTGVQVADVVIGFLHIEKKSVAEVQAMASLPRFDYLCWDLYARTSNEFQFIEDDKAKWAALRGATLKAIEEGKEPEAKTAQIVADAIVGFHLKTMKRLGISYELLARESEILHLNFWDAARARLEAAGIMQLATSGKMAGCWIMKAEKDEKPDAKVTEKTDDEENIQDKVIVRSNGTVTYVGKDIAYQLWKFGLLGKDFHYKRWMDAPSGEIVWTTTTEADDPAAPHFGEPAVRVYNVIDTRQSYLQDVVAQGLRGLGHAKAAANSVHFSYAIVALTPRCAEELGYALTPEEMKKPYVEVSGRKGYGVKADDLITKLEEATLREVAKRHAVMPADEQRSTSHAIAVGALRFFLLKFTRNTIIAFDFADALSFEGETGPYCQYAVVRIRGIRRKGTEASPSKLSAESAAKFLAGAEGAGWWELLLQAGMLDHASDAAIGAQEPAFVAKYAFQLAQAFNNFYHKHHILSEADPQKRAFLLGLAEIVERQLVKALGLLGIDAPEKM